MSYLKSGAGEVFRSFASHPMLTPLTLSALFTLLAWLTTSRQLSHFHVESRVQAPTLNQRCALCHLQRQVNMQNWPQKKSQQGLTCTNDAWQSTKTRGAEAHTLGMSGPLTIGAVVQKTGRPLIQFQILVWGFWGQVTSNVTWWQEKELWNALITVELFQKDFLVLKKKELELSDKQKICFT